jgi:hypothetical protein
MMPAPWWGPRDAALDLWIVTSSQWGQENPWNGRFPGSTHQ